jgi:nitrite reductase/ring-hydroxylating ferredoxin subunit/uncharacterized membrane protein
MVADIKTQQKKNWVDNPPRTPALRHFMSKQISRLPWLDNLSNPLQNWVHKFYGQPGSATYKTKDILNGTWLGHPLHPALVSVPLGAWTGMLVLDAAWLAEQNDGVARGSDLLIWTGLAGAAGSAVSGLTNWVDTDGPERRTGMFHALLNGSATVLNIASAVLRLLGRRRTAIALSSTAYVVALCSANIGGELAYSTGVGVNHVAWEGGPGDFVAVMDVKDLPAHKLTRVDAAGTPVVLYKDGARVFALSAICSHLGGPLDEGSCENGVVHCPWHNSGFRLDDGSVVNSPAVYAQPTFDVRIHNGKVQLRRREHA